MTSQEREDEDDQYGARRWRNETPPVNPIKASPREIRTFRFIMLAVLIVLIVIFISLVATYAAHPKSG